MKRAKKFKLPDGTPKLKGESKSDERRKKAKNRDVATSSMSLTELQLRAKKEGILFGGLNKSELVEKLNWRLRQKKKKGRN